MILKSVSKAFMIRLIWIGFNFDFVVGMAKFELGFLPFAF